MVCRSLKGDAHASESLEGIGQISSCRVENRDVVEAGAGRRRGMAAPTFPCVEPDMVVIPTRGEEYRVPAVPLRYFKPEYPFIKS